MPNANPNRLGNNGGRFYSYLQRPVLIDCSAVVDSTNGNGLGIRSLKGQGIQDIFMYTTAAAGRGNSGVLNPMAHTASKGLVWVKLANNYAQYAGGFSGFVSPTTGSPLAINGSALTIGSPYLIVSPGHGTLGAATIQPVADVSGSLASKYFVIYDNYGNTWAVWFSVSGVGQRPSLGQAAPDGMAGLHYVQQSIVTNDTAATIGADLVVTLGNLPSSVAGVNSFTASGTTTVTITSTNANPQQPLPGAPADGVAPLNTGFTLATTVTSTNQNAWNGVGLPSGVVPKVGASFVATATGFSTGGSSTGTVIAPGVSGISSMEVIGDVNQSLGPIPMGGSANVGGWVLVQLLGPTSSSVATLAPIEPADGSVIGMSFYVDAG